MSKKRFDITIDEEHEDAISLLFELMQNFGVVDAGKYLAVENKYPQYFNSNGFIDYSNYLNSIIWMPNVNGYCAYILVLSNGKTYKGYTGNFIIRMVDHFNGTGCKTTRNSKPVYILHYQVCESMQEAMALEQYFKTLSGIDKITKRLAPLNTIKPE